MTKKYVNGVLMDMTPEEEAQRITDAENEVKEKQAFDDAKAEHDSLKASAKAKLISGEALTEEEANTIVL